MGRLSLNPPDALILAGGRGRRMGGLTKGALELASGEAVLAHILAALAPIVRRTHVVAPPDLHPDLSRLTSAPLLSDLGTGPANAIISAARAIDAELVFLLASDLAGLSTELLRWVLEAYSGDEDAVIPIHEGRPQPLLGLYRRAVLAEQTLSPGASVRALLGGLRWRGLESAGLPEALTRGLSGFNTWDEAKTWGIRRGAPLAKEPEPRE